MPGPSRRHIFAGKTVAIFSVIPFLIHAYQSGPDPGKTGAPGDSLCIESGCHVGTANVGPGSVKIDAGGATYTPGVKQRIRVTVSDPAQRRWGFQLTARLAGNSRTRAGLLAPIDDNTQILCSASNFLTLPCSANPTLQFIEHTQSGARITAVGAGLTFQFDWTPPDTDVGAIVLYAAGNAANGNLLETGDNIYTASLTLTTGAGGGTRPSISGAVNGASLEPDISPNGWVAILGSGLANGARAWNGSDFDGNRLPTVLDGASVTINGKDAFVQFISPDRLNVLAPADTSLGLVSVQVNFNGSALAAATARMQQFTPAFFLIDKYIAATHADAACSGRPRPPSRVRLSFCTEPVSDPLTRRLPTDRFPAPLRLCPTPSRCGSEV